jgi:hypothetical protein
MASFQIISNSSFIIKQVTIKRQATSQRYVLEDSTFYNHRCKNIKSK